VNAGLPERFVGVQVANAREECLVQQQRLDATFASPQARGQRLWVELE
jgi:hypothetical protein